MRSDRIRTHLEGVHGIDLSVTPHPGVGRSGIQVRPYDLHQNEGFSIEVELGWRSITGTLRPGVFASEMVRAFGEADPESRGIAASFLRTLRTNGQSTELIINGSRCPGVEPENWPETEWRTIELSARKVDVVPEEMSDLGLEAVVAESAVALLGFALSLAPKAEVEPDPGGRIPEGASTTVVANRYERSAINRAACLAAHGHGCSACGLILADRYGPIADRLVHVHHVTPVSELGPDYLVDPVRDLIPLCPNCHAVAHRRDPPLPVEEIKAFLAQQRL